ncbi:hypothetical protein L7F22_026669, partial [Adiantum nelumboides]|nr:hypothetical protein [Adiantum nelumboides]
LKRLFSQNLSRSFGTRRFFQDSLAADSSEARGFSQEKVNTRELSAEKIPARGFFSNSFRTIFVPDDAERFPQRIRIKIKG